MITIIFGLSEMLVSALHSCDFSPLTDTVGVSVCDVHPTRMARV